MHSELEAAKGMDKFLITGAGGFLGRYLCDRLKKTDCFIVGLDLDSVPPTRADSWVKVNKGEDLANAVSEHRPDLVIHCAFINRKPGDWSDHRYLENTLSQNLPIFRECAGEGTPILLISSSAVYGSAEGSSPIDENCPMKPVTLYGVAKVLQETLAQYYAAVDGLKLCIARLFNLIGPGQSPGMLLPDWVSRVSAIADGAEPVLKVRNRATTRDFVDVRDATRALELLLRNFHNGEVVNVASGVPVTLKELSDALEQLSPVPYQIVETDPAVSASDPVLHYGSNARLKALYGWSPKIHWKQSLNDIWQAYRGKKTWEFPIKFCE